MTDMRWSTEGLTENFVDVLAREHGLYVGPGGKELVGEGLDDARVPITDIDIEFARLNPNLPVENVCSRLDNYLPQNPTQEALLGAAQKLVSYMNPGRLAGFIACGEAGLGKTHVSVGAAKASMLTGQKTVYHNVPSGREMYRGSEFFKAASVAEIVIVDDMNHAYQHSARDGMVALLGHMHNQGGGKLMITSNAPSPQAFLDQFLLPQDQTERVRVSDRVSSALLGLTITGESYRSVNTAGQTPWWQE